MSGEPGRARYAIGIPSDPLSARPQKTGSFMQQRIRLAMQSGSFQKMSGTVEADETFVGGKARNMHKGARKAKGRGTAGKAVVMGLLERHATAARSART